MPTSWVHSILLTSPVLPGTLISILFVVQGCTNFRWKTVRLSKTIFECREPRFGHCARSGRGQNMHFRGFAWRIHRSSTSWHDPIGLHPLYHIWVRCNLTGHRRPCSPWGTANKFPSYIRRTAINVEMEFVGVSCFLLNMTEILGILCAA